MVEGSLRSFEPLAYHVNNFGDLNTETVIAHRDKDTNSIKKLLSTGERTDYDVFICVNKDWHAFVMCVPANAPTPSSDPLGVFKDIPDDPFAIPSQLFVWETELCFESVEQRMYKIHHKMKYFSEIKGRIERSFYIHRFKQLTIHGIQLSILRASPRRYKVLLDDCVEFAKTMCYELLSFCSNAREIESAVETRLNEASGSGLSVEKLSRRVKSSARLGNSFLGGMDMSTFLGGRWGVGAYLAVFFLFTLYTVVLSAGVCYLVLYFSTTSCTK